MKIIIMMMMMIRNDSKYRLTICLCRQCHRLCFRWFYYGMRLNDSLSLSDNPLERQILSHWSSVILNFSLIAMAVDVLCNNPQTIVSLYLMSLLTQLRGSSLNTLLFTQFIPGGLLGLNFAGYVSLASQNPYPVIVYSVARYRAHIRKM